MIINLVRLKRYLFFTICLFLKGLIISTFAMASNEVLKVKAMEDQGRAGIMVFFRERPSYSLYAVSEAHILLTFDDTIKGDKFEKDFPEGNMFDLNEARNAVAVRLDVNLQRPFTRIDSSWIEDKKLLYIDMDIQTGPAGVIKPYKNETSLQDIRFGFIENGTRMVMKVDNSPSWKMAFDALSIVKMRLIDVSNEMKKSQFGPVKLLKGVDISGTKDKAVDLSLKLESPFIRVSVLRMPEEGRLVLDIMDQPGQIPDEATVSDNKTPITGSVEKGEQPEGTVIEDKGNYLRVKINKKESPSGVFVTGEATEVSGSPGKSDTHSNDNVMESDTGLSGQKGVETDGPMAGETGVKTDVDRDDGTDSGIKDEAPPREADAGHGTNAADTFGDTVKIEPKLDNTMPMTTELKHEMADLSPEEAFLYGRVKQTMDIKDYEKALLLIDQFLKELPDSPLVEDMMFLRGDLYYYLWRNGDEGVLDKVISSYQKAIDRYPKSGSVTSGYIKMSQAQSYKGEEYLALGYLGLIITRRDNEDILPLAYLTRGKIFMRLKQYEKALADFNVIMEQYADSEYLPEAHFWTANYYHAVGQYENAEKSLEEVLNLDPVIFVKYPEYLFLRAKNFLYLEDYDGAREYLFKAVNIGRQQEGADMLLTRIGDTYHNQDNEKEAEKFYRMVVDYYPETEGASISRLRMADYSSDTSVLDEISTYTDNESISELALLQKGYRQYDKGQYASVVETVKPLVDKPVETETRKSAKRLFFNAAEKEIAGLYQEGKFKDLTDFYTPEKDLLDKEIKIETMLKVAMAFKEVGLYEEAIRTFKGIRLSELNLQQGGAYFTGFAETYLGNGDKDDARDLLEKAKNYNLQPVDKQRVSRTLALLYIEENMLNDAQSLCNSIIEGERLLPEDELADVYFLSGRILNLQKRYSDAEAAINAAPGMPDRIKNDSLMSAYMELGKAYYHTGNYPGAVRSFEKGFDLGYAENNKDYWNLRLDLAQAYADNGEHDRARALLSEISESGDSISQQKAALKIGSMDLEEQLKRLPIGRD